MALCIELVTTAILACGCITHTKSRGTMRYGTACFHAVSAFNNAGFSTYSDGLAGFALDPLILGPIMAAVILGGVGFPVLRELLRDPRRPAKWSLHTKLTLLGTALLLLGGTLLVLAYEWSNPATLGPLGSAGKLLNAAFHAVMTRSAGFNTLDIGQLRQETLGVSYVLMLIGGGSASTAGGIKVTTFWCSVWWFGQKSEGTQTCLLSGAVFPARSSAKR
jgi:Trk-type K+ transport system membrane component